MDVMALLEVTIGIVLVYLVLSLVCTSLLEAVIGAMGFKSRNLQTAIETLVGSKSLADELYGQPEIVALQGPKGQRPSYIPPDVFARSILTLTTGGEWRKSGGLPTVLRERFVELAGAGDKDESSQKLGERLVEFIDEAEGDIEVLKNKIELWFDRTNDRSKGWFKRRVNWWLIGIGFVVALVVNADTIRIFQRLSEDPALREAAVALAEQRVENGQVQIPDSGEAPLTAVVREQVGEVAPFIGWSEQDPFVDAVRGKQSGPIAIQTLVKILGLLLTAFAISLGAPFWFDLLQKLVNVRKSVAPERAEEIKKGGAEGAVTGEDDGESDAVGGAPTEAYTGPIAGFSPNAAKLTVGNAHFLARAADLAYEKDNAKLVQQVQSWGMQAHLFESTNPDVTKSWKGKLTSPDTQGFIAADDNAVIVAFRGTEPTQPADIVTDLKFAKVADADYGRGEIHEGFKAALDSIWDELLGKLTEYGNKKQPVWFTGHSLGGALAVLAAARYERVVAAENAAAKKELEKIEDEMEPDKHDDAALLGRRQQVVAKLRGRVAGAYTIGQPRVGDPGFVEDVEKRIGERHVRTINNRDIVPRVPLRSMDYDHSGTVLYLDEFGRLHRDPGLWLRLLDTVVISKAEVKKASEGVKDHNSRAYVDLLDKARKNPSALTRLAVSR